MPIDDLISLKFEDYPAFADRRAPGLQLSDGNRRHRHTFPPISLLFQPVMALDLNHILSMTVARNHALAALDCGEQASRRLHSVIFPRHRCFPTACPRNPTKRSTRIWL
ncbi:MAG: hypothetical protein Q7T08_07315 [Devosia sp.]|nr:hypothetical protein [Devosia sp.]